MTGLTEKPTAPSISCPGIVAENSSLTCTCNATSIGQPAGRLQWSRGNGGSVTLGGYGAVTLDLPPQTVTRADHGVTQFQCAVDWASGSFRERYTANVGCECV